MFIVLDQVLHLLVIEKAFETMKTCRWQIRNVIAKSEQVIIAYMRTDPCFGLLDQACLLCSRVICQIHCLSCSATLKIARCSKCA